MIQSSSRSERLNFRIAKDLKDTIERAAARMGQSVSEFALSVLNERACDVLNAESQTQLSDRDRDLFLRLLDAEAGPNDELRKAAALYKQQRGA